MDEKVVFFGYYKTTPIAFYISIPELNEVLMIYTSYVDNRLGGDSRLDK